MRKLVKVNIGFHLFYGFFLIFLAFSSYGDPRNQEVNNDNSRAKALQFDDQEKDSFMQRTTPVIKKVLKNGLTVLVRELHNIPKVTVQMWYNVGSKDEKSGERGIAHLIEHMIFKGTKKLSETDINVVSHMLSGNINAFTSHDYTGYLFNFPTHHWKETLPIIADCMLNCAFKDDHLNSEMKAVIQELKMYKDNYQMSLIEELTSAIFPDHPYHYPIIGFKQDLWSVNGEDLRSFYKKHYLPNNAALVVVGDVNAQEVFDDAEKYFGAIPANKEYKKEKHYFNKDLGSKAVTLYRDVKLPLGTYVFVTPGISTGKEHLLEVAASILGSGKSSRLHKKLVDELQVATSLSAVYWDLFDHSLFFVVFEPKTAEDIPVIEAVIEEEINSILKNGLDAKELERAVKQARMHQYSVLEEGEKQAFEIGKSFIATGDENYVYNYLNEPLDKLTNQMEELFKTYFRPAVMHKGIILPLPETERAEWDKLQHLSDEEDERILSRRTRETPLEDPLYAKQVKVKEPAKFDFPKSSTLKLSNGIKVLHYHNDNKIPKITLLLQFKARSFYGPEELPGLYNFVMDMLLEGTENYTSSQLAEEIESRGMSFQAYPGLISMSMLNSDLEFGLKILEEILTKATFKEEEIEKVRSQIIADIKNFWDEPKSFASQLVKETVYKGHPYSKDILGTEESIKKIKRKDLVDFYKKYLSPNQATIAIVGDIKNANLKETFEKNLSMWQGSVIEDVQFPKLSPCNKNELDYPINRDQVVLCYAGLSVDRKHPDYDKLQLFDQIFGGGNLGSLHSKLFQLREQSGLFYGINGTLLSNADEQPGMVLIKTMVSLDRLKEAEQAIESTVSKVTDTITDEELVEARHAIVNTIVDNFKTNKNIAWTFLWLDRFNLPSDYYDNKAEDLKKINLPAMQTAVKKVLLDQKLSKVRVGRVGTKKQTEVVM